MGWFICCLVGACLLLAPEQMRNDVLFQICLFLVGRLLQLYAPFLFPVRWIADHALVLIVGHNLVLDLLVWQESSHACVLLVVVVGLPCGAYLVRRLTHLPAVVLL